MNQAIKSGQKFTMSELQTIGQKYQKNKINDKLVENILPPPQIANKKTKDMFEYSPLPKIE